MIKQYSLGADCERLLGSVNVKRTHNNRSSEPADSPLYMFSDRGRQNLRRFLAKDCACLMQLHCLGVLSVDEILPLLG